MLPINPHLMAVSWTAVRPETRAMSKMILLLAHVAIKCPHHLPNEF